MTKKIIPTLFYLLVSLINFLPVTSQTVRSKEIINDNWQFLNDGIDFGQSSKLIDGSNWSKINLPHTWNSADPFDDAPGYRRGVSWYRKTVKLNAVNRSEKMYYLHFEGVNQVADVYVNGIFVGRHKGGYTAFTLDITNALSKDETQQIAVMVNSSHDPFIAPLSVGYALYGGIYRDVWLVTTNKVHFDMNNYGSSGIFVKTPEVNHNKAKVSISGTIVNDNFKTEDIVVKTEIYDASDNKVGSFESTLQITPKQKIEFNHFILINNPNLWSPDNPYLYTVKSIVLKEGKEIDNVENPLGLRWFSFDPQTGFSLNGEHLKLRGTNRHQDRLGKGSALSNAEHRHDMQLIKDMGCNFIRIAHYPQDPEILKAADELGLLAWEEVPLVNYMTISPEFLDNSKEMLKEMIRQNFNHPSLIIWGSMNEIFLWDSREERSSKQTDSVYTKKVAEYTKILDQTIRDEDPHRYSTLAMHESGDYDKVGIEDIPQISSYNFYSGWYGGKFEDFGYSIDKKHKAKPNQVIFISEYGAESDNSLNSEKPLRYDSTGQYQRLFNESYLKQIESRDFLSGSAIWNQFDFSQPHIGGSIPNMNKKGMVSFDRKPKDVYYLFQANWSKEPMLYIAEKDWPVRAITGGSKKYTITVYSNLKEVSLFQNGKKIKTKSVGDLNKVEFDVVLEKGLTNLKATGNEKGKTFEDFCGITVQEYNAEKNPSIAINIGSNAQYLDYSSNKAWIEDHPFDGYFGYEGGKQIILDRKSVMTGGLHNGLFYTALEGMSSYKIKTKNGKYKLTLYFMEMEKVQAGQRVFDVSINGTNVISALDLSKEAGFCYGIAKTFEVEVLNNQIVIAFNALSGKALLNGLELVKSN